MRRWLCGGLLVVLAGCALPSDGAGSAPPAETVSRGLGTKDASRDVKLASFERVEEYGLVRYVGKLVITNHTSKPSDYYIELSIENRAGDNIGWTNAVAEHVKPGQKARVDFEVFDEGAHRAVIHEIQRTESP